MSKMQYSPKLKVAMEEIKAVLEKHDIAGAVILHTPGYGEHLLKLGTSYSCCKIEGGTCRIKATKEDYGSSKLRDQALTDTSNMLEIMSRLAFETFTLPLMHMSEKLDKVIDVKHDDKGYTSHETQNN